MGKALVTGGAGFIGSHLVEALVSQGWEVTVLDNLSSGKRSNLDAIADRIDFHLGDILDLPLLERLCRGCHMVFHQAAVVSVPQTVADPIETSRINDLGTLQVLEAARRAAVARVVLASSCAVYGDDPRLPKAEHLPPAPRSPYAVQKLVGEFHARLYHELYGLPAVALRYFNVYGPRQDPSSPYSGVISIFMARAAAGLPATLHGDGRQTRDFVFVRDVVAANLRAAMAPGASGQVFNVGTGRQVAIAQLWEMICQLAGGRLAAAYEAERPGDVRASVADTRLSEEQLVFKADCLLEAGLSETYRWLNAQG